MKKGHYESASSIYEDGEIPKCDICGKPATYDTHISGVAICDEPKCHTAFIEQQCDPIEYVEG